MMDDPDSRVPPLDAALVQTLNERFPERCPDPEDSDREIWMKAGERRLVRWLNRIFQQQTEAEA